MIYRTLKFLQIGLVVFFGSSSVQQAQAAPTLLSFDFSATGFFSVFGDPPPIDPVTGSVSVLFDPTDAPILGETAGITAVIPGIAVDGPIGFDYVTGNMIIGGLVAGFGSDPGTMFFEDNDFVLTVDNVFGSVSGVFSYVNATSQVWENAPVVFSNLSLSTVPAPGALALLSFGLLGLGMRRRTV